MLSEEKGINAKLVLLGNSGVGKTCLAIRYTQGTFQENQPPTIGASFLTKRKELDGWKIKLQIWDTAGQERFRSMTPMYYRGAHGAIIVYDVSSPESFEAVRTWVAELRRNLDTDPVIVLAGNKCDKEDASVDRATVEEYAKNIGSVLFYTSSKTNEGIEELFETLVNTLLKRVQSRVQSESCSPDQEIKVSSASAAGKAVPKKGCCN